MIIDFHTHTFPEKIAAPTIEKLEGLSHTHAHTDGTQSGLLAAMDTAGVDLSVALAVATNPGQVAKLNDRAAARNGQGKILAFGSMHPDLEDWESELERIAALGLKGIKIHPVYQGADLDDVRYLRILDKCGQLGLIVITHTGLDIGFPGKVNCTPAMARRAIQSVGPVKLVLAHMGGWFYWDEVVDTLVDTSVYIDTSHSLGILNRVGMEPLQMLRDEQFVDIIRGFGAHRVLFGTDSPWGGQQEELAHINALDLTEEEKRMILGENAANLLGIM